MAKFSSTSFGILELHAEPALPITLRNIDVLMNTKHLKIHSERQQSPVKITYTKPSAQKFSAIPYWLAN